MFRFQNSLLLILLLCHMGAVAQKPFKQLVEELKNLCLKHESLYPDYGVIAFKDEGLTLNMLITEYPKEFEATASHDSIDIGSLKFYYRLKIRQKFKQLMHHPGLLKHDVAQLLPSMLVSEDKKFYSLSIDEGTGGSYHSRFTMYHYTGMAKNDEADFEGFAEDGYYEIFTLKTKQGTKYLLIGTVLTCNTCRSTYALLTHFKDGKFVNDFETMIDGRMGSEINYDLKKKILHVFYQTSDLIRECSCIIGQEQFTFPAIAGMESDIQDCSCTYKFNGSTFELTSQQQSQAGKE